MTELEQSEFRAFCTTLTDRELGFVRRMIVRTMQSPDNAIALAEISQGEAENRGLF